MEATNTRPAELAALVEFSEARAYSSLVQAAPKRVLDEYGMAAITIGSASAIVAEAVTTSLNMNRVIGLGIAEEATEAMIDEVVDVYSSRGLSFGIELGPYARPSELDGWMRARRIRRGMATAMHYRAAATMVPPESPLSVVRAKAGARGVVAEICCKVFRMPPAAHASIAATADLPRWRQWLAYDGETPVAAALSFIDVDVGWLGWDATLPEFRGRGAQAALIAHRVNEAAALGCRYITTETATIAGSDKDPSYRNYERAGFVLAYERATYVALRKRPANV